MKRCLYNTIKRMQKFDIDRVILQLSTIVSAYTDQKQIPFSQFCAILDEFCLVFKALNSFLGVAFSDVKEKVTIIRGNNQTFKGHAGFLSFVCMEIDLGIHVYNGDNNASKKAAKQYKKYNSTARNLLRMMWLLTFIRVTFSEIQEPAQSMSDVLCKAYDAAFGEKHSWLIRKGAKLAIKASGNRGELIASIMGKQCPEQEFQEKNKMFLERLIVVHQALWGFYTERGLTNLE